MVGGIPNSQGSGEPGGPPVTFSGEFVAPVTGDLFLFANDAMLPFGRRGLFGYNSTFFYDGPGVGNEGSACVTIQHHFTFYVEVSPTFVPTRRPGLHRECGAEGRRRLSRLAGGGPGACLLAPAHPSRQDPR